MSHQAVSWALQQPIEHSPAKFILVALAHFVSHDQEAPWRAYASVSTLVRVTGQNRKTVLANMERLVDAGCLIDTGERIGGTKSVVVYELSEPLSGMEIGTASNRVSNPKIGTPKPSQNVAEAVPKLDISSTENGIASTHKAVPILDGSSPKIGRKQSQNVAEAVPKSSTEEGYKEKQEENIKPSRSKPQALRAVLLALPLPDWLPPQSWADWVDHRIAVKSPMTERAADLALKHLERLKESGNDPVLVIEQSVRSGKWTDLYPIRDQQRGSGNAIANPPVAAIDRWWITDAGVDRKGREIGMFARGGESYSAFKDRIFSELRRRGEAEHPEAA